MIVRILSLITVTHCCMCISAKSQAHASTRISQHDLIKKKSSSLEEKELSTCGENYTTANDDIAFTSSMIVRDQNREMKLSNGCN